MADQEGDATVAGERNPAVGVLACGEKLEFRLDGCRCIGVGGCGTVLRAGEAVWGM